MSDNKINTGAIFKNKNKTATNHPDYKGSVNANGKDMDVAICLRENKNGVKYFSVALSEPFVRETPATEHHENTPPPSDDLPF